MTRIIAGAAGGRRLATPPGEGTRPTSDRVREAIFSRLTHLDVLAGAAVLDLYAGSGALALEALSRGAVHATLVEASRKAAGVARRNGATVGLGEVVVRAEPVEKVLAAPAPRRFDVVFADPPYDVDEPALAGVLAGLLAHHWLASDVVLVVERSTRTPEPTWPPGVERFDVKTYGETRVWYADLPASQDEPL